MTDRLHLRLMKFSMAGAIGVGVQLGALAALSRIGINYLFATALAVECAILHNFVWHRHFTYAYRMQNGIHGLFSTLLRFHLSNGLISLFCNLLLMRTFVGALGLPLLPANLVTISACFVANFMASDRWVFRSS